MEYEDELFFDKANIDVSDERPKLLNFICCGYWFLNSVFGMYILWSYPELLEEDKDSFIYVTLFSLKWVWSLLITFLLMFLSSCTMRYCCQAQDLYSQMFGLFPLLYLFVIYASYLYSLFYGVSILINSHFSSNSDSNSIVKDSNL
mmetsp:Transcript_8193/g.7618  ORF Transcript_8193/g.7618 Transcript_8193/m.7618 type:complete len:146 (+) Transcript_8193:181-618(+)